MPAKANNTVRCFEFKKSQRRKIVQVLRYHGFMLHVDSNAQVYDLKIYGEGKIEDRETCAQDPQLRLRDDLSLPVFRSASIILSNSACALSFSLFDSDL